MLLHFAFKLLLLVFIYSSDVS